MSAWTWTPLELVGLMTSVCPVLTYILSKLYQAQAAAVRRAWLLLCVTLPRCPGEARLHPPPLQTRPLRWQQWAGGQSPAVPCARRQRAEPPLPAQAAPAVRSRDRAESQKPDGHILLARDRCGASHVRSDFL